MDEALKKYILEKLELLDDLKNGISPSEADMRAGEFLLASATLSEYRLQYATKYSRMVSAFSVTNYKVWQEVDAKTAKDKEAATEANKEYIVARENEEAAKHDLQYISSIIEVFNNAHVHFRQISNKAMGR